MEFALTFGSVGDIIAICQVALQLRHALKGGSAKEYQRLREDLDAFTRILMLVLGTFEQRENSPYMSGLSQATKSAVEECATAIQSMYDRLQSKYGDILGVQSSSHGQLGFTSARRKLEWSIIEKGHVAALQEVLRTNTQRLTLLMALAAKNSNRVDNETLLSRIAIVDEHMRKVEVQGDEIISLLRQQAATDQQQHQQLSQVNTELQKQTSSLGSLQLILTGIYEVKDRIGELTQAVVSLQVSISNSFFLRPLDPTRELPVTLEDSLGRLLPLPVEWVESMEWATLHRLLLDRFRGSKGFSMVQTESYTFEDNASGRDLARRDPLSTSLRRGMKVNMKMNFWSEDIDASPGRCPRCRRVSEGADGTTIQCQTDGCGMFFQLETDYMENNYSHSDHSSTSPADAVNFDGYAQPGEEAKTSRCASMKPTPTDFQRVRILHLHSMREAPNNTFASDSDTILRTVTPTEGTSATHLDSSTGPESIGHHHPTTNTASPNKDADNAQLNLDSDDSGPTLNSQNPSVTAPYSTSKTYRTQSYSVGPLDPAAAPPVVTAVTAMAARGYQTEFAIPELRRSQHRAQSWVADGENETYDASLRYSPPQSSHVPLFKKLYAGNSESRDSMDGMMSTHERAWWGDDSE